jgi:alkylhydroperoxidase family enzyme
MPRIPPLPPQDWSPEMRAAIAALRPANARLPAMRREGRPKALNALGTLARHPELAKAFNAFNGHLLFSSTLSERQRELVILRVAVLRQSEYEWKQHVILAGDVGISEEEIARVAAGPEAPGWSPLERAVVSAVDELVGEAMVADGTWEVLVGSLQTEQIMDLVFTVGAYDLLAMAFRSFGVELDDDLAAT